jgi:hypothetical protein
LLAKRRLDDAAKSIDSAARRPRHDQTDRSGGIILASTGDGGSSRDGGGQKPGKTTARKHAVTPKNAQTKEESGAGAPSGLSRDSGRSQAMGWDCSPLSKHRLAGGRGK